MSADEFTKWLLQGIYNDTNKFLKNAWNSLGNTYNDVMLDALIVPGAVAENVTNPYVSYATIKRLEKEHLGIANWDIIDRYANAVSSDLWSLVPFVGQYYDPSGIAFYQGDISDDMRDIYRNGFDEEKHRMSEEEWNKLHLKNMALEALGGVSFIGGGLRTWADYNFFSGEANEKHALDIGKSFASGLIGYIKDNSTEQLFREMPLPVNTILELAQDAGKGIEQAVQYFNPPKAFEYYQKSAMSAAVSTGKNAYRPNLYMGDPDLKRLLESNSDPNILRLIPEEGIRKYLETEFIQYHISQNMVFGEHGDRFLRPDYEPPNIDHVYEAFIAELDTYNPPIGPLAPPKELYRSEKEIKDELFIQHVVPYMEMNSYEGLGGQRVYYSDYEPLDLDELYKNYMATLQMKPYVESGAMQAALLGKATYTPPAHINDRIDAGAMQMALLGQETYEMETNNETTINVSMHVDQINEASDIDDMMIAVGNHLAEVAQSALGLGA